MQPTNQPGGPGQGVYPPPNFNQPPYPGQGPTPNQPPPYPSYPPPGMVPPKKRSNRVLFIILGAVAVIVVVVAALALTVPAGPVAIAKAVLAKDYQNKAAVNETTVFSPTDPKLHTVVNLDNPKTGTKLKAIWYVVAAGDLQNQKIGETEITSANEENVADFTFTPSVALPVGTYKVELYLDGTLNRTLNFTVQ